MGTAALYTFLFFLFFDGYCSTVQGLLDWFGVDLGFTELSFMPHPLALFAALPQHTFLYREWKSNSAGGGGLGSRPKKMYGERLGDGVEYYLMSPTPRR